MIHKEWNITSCLDFDLNRSASKKKKVFKYVYFLALSTKMFAPCKWQWTGVVGAGGGGGEKKNL